METTLSKIDLSAFGQKDLGKSLNHSVQQATSTYLLVWDASDKLNNSFVENAIDQLDGGADIVFGGYEIVDENDEVLEEYAVPPFLLQTKGETRCFEDMFLPDCRTFAVRTGFAWKLGFDEDLKEMHFQDFILRAIDAGGKFKCLDEPAVRKSVAPRLDTSNTNEYVSILCKFDYERLRELYTDADIDEKSIQWAMALIATKREDFDSALEYLQSFLEKPKQTKKAASTFDPYPQSDEWKYLFMRGTISLLKSNTEEALPFLQKALEQHMYFEAMNNCGVVHRMNGDETMAKSCFEIAFSGNSSYLDAKRNLNDPEKLLVTRSPLIMKENQLES